MSEELWHWLMDRGWRAEETHRDGKQIFRDIPPSYVTRLIDVHPLEREALMIEAMAGAQTRLASFPKRL